MFLYLKNIRNESANFISILTNTGIELNTEFVAINKFNSIINQFARIINQHIFEPDGLTLKQLEFIKEDGIKEGLRTIRFDHIVRLMNINGNPQELNDEQKEVIRCTINEKIACDINYNNENFQLEYQRLFIILKGKQLKQIYYNIFMTDLEHLANIKSELKKFSQNLEENFKKNKFFPKDIFDIFDSIFENFKPTQQKKERKKRL
jgi:hypothetical protein